MSAIIHPTAIVFDNVTIGANSYIGPFCVIGAPAEKKLHQGAQVWASQQEYYAKRKADGEPDYWFLPSDNSGYRSSDKVWRLGLRASEDGTPGGV